MTILGCGSIQSGFQSHNDSGPTIALLLARCSTLGKLINPSDPQFPHL